MQFTRTLLAAAALAASLSAQAGMLGQSVQQYLTIDGTVGGGNAGILPTVVGNQVELSNAQLSPIFAPLMVDSYFNFDWSDDRLTIEYGSGAGGHVTDISYALRLLDSNSRFTSMFSTFDNFGAYSNGGWTATMLDSATVLLTIEGLQTGSPLTSYSTAAQFGFTVETSTPTPPTPTPPTQGVPEPASLALVAAALAGLAASRRRRA